MANEYRLTTVASEVLHTGGTGPGARVTTVAIEVLHAGGVAAEARVTTIGVEVLRTVTTLSSGEDPSISILW